MGTFASGEARQAFLDAYERAMALWPDDREMLDVETSCGTTRVYRHGVTHGDPVVLVHGHGGNASNWYALVRGLGARQPVYAVDTVQDPGGSVQTAPMGDPAAWLEEVLAGLGLERAHVVGHSYGGWLVLGLAIRGSGRVSRITLLDPGGLERVRPAFLIGLFAAVFAMRAPSSWKPRLARMLADHALVERPEIMAPVMIGVRWFRSDRPPARPYRDEALRRIAVPVQLILGGRTRMLRPRRAAARARRLLPGSCRVEIVPGVGHGVPQEVPELVIDRIVSFRGTLT
ncbi:alpha/beta fold hydrolase [Nonomuraea sp. SYSU D8015]|uniref:alpha/beta fold hydrolase n=1 Tax=Nonomuraea sp. SYSU D8015 TaxID=2593644 RepID=UPI001CB6BEF9|nr:alpha/beta fold hydrolase [Nonomuraea sp. SYSU D8015]